MMLQQLMLIRIRSQRRPCWVLRIIVSRAGKKAKQDLALDLTTLKADTTVDIKLLPNDVNSRG